MHLLKKNNNNNNDVFQLSTVFIRLLTRLLTRLQVLRFNVCRLLTLPKGFNKRPYWMRELQFEYSYAIEFGDPVELYANKV
jgi:hypothetical protein